MLSVEEYLRRSLLARVYDVARETPLERAPKLSARLGCEVWLKREDLQPIFSFKLRGAYNKMVRLSEEERARGVVAASAGNHAQGVALAAWKLGCHAQIAMPVTTPTIKVDAVRALGAEVVLVGDTLEQAADHARELAAAGRTYVHPYDDPDVIAGQGTVAIEVLRHLPGRLDAVFVPVGGGGLAAGMGAVVKALRPEVRVVAVEPENADAMTRSLRSGTSVSLAHVSRFAEGVAVRTPGTETLRVCRQVVDDAVVVTNDEICAAIRDLFEDRRALLEPSGALAFAGLTRWLTDHPEASGGVFVAVASGANINFERLGQITERANIGGHHEAVFAVTIPERPGSFRELCSALGGRNVTECNYRHGDARDAHVFLGVRVQTAAEAAAFASSLRARGYEVLDLSTDELAKSHVRHMVGGRAPQVANERLLSFWFPERSGALAEFLGAMRHPWDISLFHYRNGGSDFARVLVGLVVEDRERDALDEFLSRVGFEWASADDNPSCRRFLR